VEVVCVRNLHLESTLARIQLEAVVAMWTVARLLEILLMV
jgi:hypothetical protein